jgi:hypothetical protein
MRFDDTNPAKEKEDFEKVSKVFINLPSLPENVAADCVTSVK